MTKLAILASGSGSNAENIVNYFKNHPTIRVALILTNNAKAGVIERANRLGISCLVFSKSEMADAGPDGLAAKMKAAGVDYVILAGFLLLVPAALLNAFLERIINIHPALLPDFGGKGYYGMHVHEAVIRTKSIISGITVHRVNGEFDKGAILFQAACHVDASDTPESLAQKIHSLEYTYFPTVIEKTISASST